jgi:hypothetical protein
VKNKEAIVEVYEKQARDWAHMIQYEKLSKEDRKVAIAEFNNSVSSMLNNCAPNERAWLFRDMDELRRKIGA